MCWMSRQLKGATWRCLSWWEAEAGQLPCYHSLGWRTPGRNLWLHPPWHWHYHKLLQSIRKQNKNKSGCYGWHKEQAAYKKLYNVTAGSLSAFKSLDDLWGDWLWPIHIQICKTELWRWKWNKIFIMSKSFKSYLNGKKVIFLTGHPMQKEIVMVLPCPWRSCSILNLQRFSVRWV